jgi:NAD+ kinase
MKIAIVGNREKAGISEALLRLTGELERGRVHYCVEEELLPLFGGRSVPGGTRAVCFEGADLVIACGGDGTILAAARQVGAREIPVLGVNLGKLGFIAEVSPDEVEEAVREIVGGRYVVEDRLVLEATSPNRPGKVYHAVNDMVIDRARSPRIIDLQTYIDGVYAVTYRGDGLIVSTPTGSTAYALSNGGPIVTPTSSVIGITPISPHTLSGRPHVIPDHCAIRIVVGERKEEVLFSADGQTEEFFAPPAELVIGKAPYVLRLVKRVGRSYFEMLRAKLYWGQDPRGDQGRS